MTSPYADEADLKRVVDDLTRPCQCFFNLKDHVTIGSTSVKTMSSFQFLEIPEIQPFVMPVILSHVLADLKLNFQVENQDLFGAMDIVIHPPSAKPISRMQIPSVLAQEIIDNVTSKVFSS